LEGDKEEVERERKKLQSKDNSNNTNNWNQKWDLNQGGGESLLVFLSFSKIQNTFNSLISSFPSLISFLRNNLKAKELSVVLFYF